MKGTGLVYPLVAFLGKNEKHLGDPLDDELRRLLSDHRLLVPLVGGS